MKSQKKPPLYRASSISSEPIRLVLLPGFADGEQRAALDVPPSPSTFTRRRAFLTFASVSAAIAAKVEMENGHARR